MIEQTNQNMSGMVLATVKEYTPKKGVELKADINGEFPIVLDVFSGKFPNARVLSGTFAKHMGIEVGEAYLFNFEEEEADEEWGRQFDWTMVKKLSLEDVIKNQKAFGPAVKVEVKKKSDTTTEETTPEMENNVQFDKVPVAPAATPPTV